MRETRFGMSGPWERIVVGLALACALMAPSTVAGQNRAALEAELERLRTDLRIPSMSAAVVEGGTVVWVRHFGIKPPPGDVVRYPIASLTKPFAAILALRDVERGRLTLDTAVSRPDGTRVQIRHLLSQTAAGMPGARFLYSSELYRLLGGPLASAAGTTLPVALAADVIRPLGLRHTIAGASVTASSGLESTVEDLARFAAALERGAVLSPLSLTEMFRPPRSPSGRAFPYALGWFVDQVGGEQVRWHFGQEQEVSGLMLMLPRRRLAFVVLARTDRLSAPFWLQFGDLRWSPAAAAFLAAWARIRLDLPEARRLMIQALIALAKGDRARGAALAKKASVLAPALINTADPALLAAFARSGERDLREMGRRTARRLLDIDPDHPRVLLDLAVLNLQDGQPAEAARLLRKILVDRQASPEIERTTKELLAEVGGRSP